MSDKIDVDASIRRIKKFLADTRNADFPDNVRDAEYTLALVEALEHALGCHPIQYRDGSYMQCRICNDDRELLSTKSEADTPRA